MSLETEVAALTTATTSLLGAVNISKAALDSAESTAVTAQITASAAAGTASTQAGIATTQAGKAAASAASAAAVVTGGTATLVPEAGKIPLADGDGVIAQDWLPNERDGQFAGAAAYATDLAGQAIRGLPLKQNLAANLTAIAALAVTDNNFIVANGSAYGAESGATARTSLGLGDSATKSVGTTAGTVAAGDALTTETDNRTLYDEELTRAAAYATDLAGQAARTLSGSLPSNVPASASAPGVAGQMRYASGFLYVCVAANTWQRVAIATWS